MSERPDPAGRFADRADDYVRGRPGYPAELFDELTRLAGLAPGARIADVGAGTGLSSEPWLARGFAVDAVEPEAAMREAALARLGGHPGFRAIAGHAEATGLAAASVDLVFAAQAFHWFDPERARAELRRILRPEGGVALVWNARRAAGSPIAVAYEALLDRFGTDYHQVGHRGVEPARLAAFFGGPFTTLHFDNHQDLDLAGLRARLLSSSYVPAAGQAGHDAMLRALEELFDAHQSGGRVRLDYDCELFFGRLAAERLAG
jgi:SAM-dependent methyltransferase